MSAPPPVGVCGLCGHEATPVLLRLDQLIIGRCPGCRAGRVLPAKDAGGHAEEYLEDYSARYTAELDRAKAKSCWRLLVETLGEPPAGTRLLELGAGDGGFLDLAREQGLRTTGLEISREAARAASERGHFMRVGSAEAPLPGEERYDWIVAWDLLEHLPSPRKCLAMAYEALAPHGTLLIATPRMGSVFDRLGLPLARLGIKQLARMCFSHDHLYRFDGEGLKRVLLELGFAQVTVKPIQLTSLSAERYAGGNILPSWTGVRALDRALSRVGFALVSALKLSNKILVVAKRGAE